MIGLLLSLIHIYKKIVGKGGVVAYLGTNDLKSVIDKKNNGDEKCKLVYDAFTVSYTHLDVYKRQAFNSIINSCKTL